MSDLINSMADLKEKEALKISRERRDWVLNNSHKKWRQGGKPRLSKR